MSAPAGWHPQPDGRERFWDGTTWTDQFRSPGMQGGDRAAKNFAFFRPWMGYVGAGVLGLVLGIGMGGATASDQAPSEARPAVTKSATATATRTESATVSTTITAGPTPTTTVTATTKVTAPPPAPVAAITEGVWTVGVDVKPGTYRVITPLEGDCYWQISKTGSNGDDIVSNDIPTGGRPQVKLKAGQDFETSECGDWARIG